MSAHSLGGNLKQHAPAGEPAAGSHPSQYWDPAMHEQQGMMLYSRYVRPGDLVFDIGANVGQRSGWFIELGCRVVAVEPQQNMAEHIPPAATRIVAAVGAEEGTLPFYVCANSPYLSTLSPEYVEQVHAQPGVAGNLYHQTTVEVVTLDGLIAEYGEPQFVKIDVEGGELGVLTGLSRPLQALSFEVHAFSPAKTEACLARLADLGDYAYMYSPLETFEPWPFPPREYAIFGDVYATRKATATA